MKQYIQKPNPPKNLSRFGRLEPPMILMSKDGEKPQFLFGTTRGGKFDASTTFVFEILN